MLMSSVMASAVVQADAVVDPVSGALIRGDFDRACRAAREGADTASPARQYLLGTCFETGTGLPQDFQEAAKWYRKAMDQGVVDAMANLGWLLARGRIAGDPGEGARLVNDAAERGSPLAELFHARLLSDQARPAEESIRWLKRSAAGGNYQAALELADILGRRDPEAAAMWRRRGDSLRQGCAASAHSATCATAVGKDVVADYNRAWRILSGKEVGTAAEAVPLVEAAAHAGHKEAEAQLGVMYMTGTGVAKDLTEAVYWLRRAVLRGYGDARRYLTQALDEAATGRQSSVNPPSRPRRHWPARSRPPGARRRGRAVPPPCGRSFLSTGA